MTVFFKRIIRVSLYLFGLKSRRVSSGNDGEGSNQQSKGVFNHILYNPPCSTNEVWEFCGSSTCWEYTCADLIYRKPFPRPCTKDCRKGCRCEKGYYRSFDGRCVDELTCTLCGYNENWYEPKVEKTEDLRCPHEYKCDYLRSILNTSNMQESFSDGRTCDTGYCYCMDGTVRTNTGHCVSDRSCLECIEPNQVYEECGSSSCWEFRCDDADWTVDEKNERACTLDCHSGCKCLPGYYRREGNGCVASDQCF